MKCELVDGAEVFATREMDDEELKAANAEARGATDGNLYWTCEPASAPCASYGEDGDIHSTG